MQRLRTGLTGLAAIFLMVLIAAAGLRPEKPAAPSGTHGETLAVLGVAPGERKPAAVPVSERAAKPAPAPRRPADI